MHEGIECRGQVGRFRGYGEFFYCRFGVAERM